MATMRGTMTWDLEPDLLRTFLVVRRHGNLTRAAEELLLSQPAVSRRVARLERSLGLPLLERLGKSLHLTEAGEVLAREAATVLGGLERLAESLRVRRSGDHGRLRIGASTTPGLYLLPEVVHAFQVRWPALDVRYSIENSLHIEEQLLRNDLDLGFVGAHLTHSALRLRPFARDRIACYVAATHPFARAKSVTPRELANEVWVVREPGSATRRMVDRWLARARIEPGRTIEVRCPEAAKVLVRAGLGVSYLSVHGLEGAGGSGLAPVTVAGFDLTRPLHVVHHADKVISPAMRAFITAATARAQDALAGG